MIEVELEVEPSQDWKLQRIQEQLRIIRNTVLGEVYKKYKQMEDMNIKVLQKKAKEVTVNEITGRFNKRKRFGKSILKRSPGYFTAQIRRRFESTGGSFKK
ncbi:hypothetical protein ACDX78_17025 [Virgibacillus oceani]